MGIQKEKGSQDHHRPMLQRIWKAIWKKETYGIQGKFLYLLLEKEDFHRTWSYKQLLWIIRCCGWKMEHVTLVSMLVRGIKSRKQLLPEWTLFICWSGVGSTIFRPVMIPEMAGSFIWKEISSSVGDIFIKETKRVIVHKGYGKKEASEKRDKYPRTN